MDIQQAQITKCNSIDSANQRHDLFPLKRKDGSDPLKSQCKNCHRYFEFNPYNRNTREMSKSEVNNFYKYY